MAGEMILTLAGNLTADPELRATAGGQSVANFTVAHTARRLDRTSGEWRDGDTAFLRCTAWGQLGERIAGTFGRGTRVLVTGTLSPHEWADRETGKTRSELRLTVEDCGASVRLSDTPVRQPGRSAAERPAAGSTASAEGTEPAESAEPPW